MDDDRLAPAGIESLAELARALRQLRRRHARRRADSVLTYRELSARTGYAFGVIAEYFSGKVLPPTDRLDVLVQLLGADGSEQAALADARDRIDERRHERRSDPQRPHDAPADVSGFVGRAAELHRLDQLLLAEPAAPLVLISGTGGVGKTALAARWAQLAAGHFPDGCLYLDLRGFGADEPVPPAEALAMMLRRLGAQQVPFGAEERAAQYRTVMAGRRLLILLDNARDPAQVRPLLPAGPRCAVIVTSRDTLAGLVARDGAHRIELGRLPAGEATSLLATLMDGRPASDRAALATLADRCARLPLALRLAAELASTRPDASVADLADELAGEQHALRMLSAGGDEQTSAAAVFSWSYRQLQPSVARMFRLLGLLPGSSVDARSAAALADLPVTEAADLLTVLRRVNLIESRPPGRFGQHDLLRAYAKTLAETEESGTDQDRAVRGLLRYQLQASQRAVRVGYGTRADSAASAALEWLAAERHNLMAGLQLAARYGWTQLVIELAGALFEHQLRSGQLDDAYLLSELQVGAARQAGDSAAECDGLSNLGIICRVQGQVEPALAHHHQALRIARRLADQARQVRALDLAAGVHHRVGRLPAAIEYYQAALEVTRTAELAPARAHCLVNLGIALTGLGRGPAARACLREALQVAAITPASVARAMQALGELQLSLGRYQAARRLFQAALLRYRALVDRTREADLLSDLAVAHRGLGQYPLAVDFHLQALEILGQMTAPMFEIGARNAYGRTLLALGDRAAAAAEHRHALELARRTGQSQDEANALAALADCSAADGAVYEAAVLRRQAAWISHRLGLPVSGSVPQPLLVSQLFRGNSGNRRGR